MLVLVVVGKQALDGVRASSHHAGRSLFWLCSERLKLSLWAVAADHIGATVDCNHKTAVHLFYLLSE